MAFRPISEAARSWSDDNDKFDTANDTYLPIHMSALSDDTDIPDAQRQYPDFKDIIAYLEQGSLPDDDIATRKTMAESEDYTLLDDKLYHLHTPRQKQKSKLQSVTQQLCLPRTVTDTVVKAYHDDNSHIGFDKLYESIRSKYYWPRMYADLSDYRMPANQTAYTAEESTIKIPIRYDTRCYFNVRSKANMM